MKRTVSLVLVLAIVLAPACGGGGPRIQITPAGEQMFSRVEHWRPIPGTDKVDKRNTNLVFGDAGLRVEDERAGAVTWAYGEIDSASYSLSKKPSWILGASLAVFICLPCLAFAFIKKKAHWIAFNSSDGPQLFRVHKTNYSQIVVALERNGIPVKNITE